MSDNIVPISENVTLPVTTPQTTTYKAYTASDRERGEYGLVLYFEDGETIEALYYAFLMRVMAASPEIFFLVCSDCVYTIYGKNLTPLMPLLCDHKIRSLQAFSDKKHFALTGGSEEMLIESIFMQSPDKWWEWYQNRDNEDAAPANLPAPQE